MDLVLVWVGLCAVVGYAASQRGRNGIGWFLLALVISPLIAGLLVLVMRPTQAPLVYAERITTEPTLPAEVGRRPPTRMQLAPWAIGLLVLFGALYIAGQH